jgi:GT2 family glycosyltransferase
MADMSANRLSVRATIVVPTRDRPELLGRAVAGALAQTVPDIQVVVVDDGSTEPVQLPPDPRLEVVRNRHPLGVSAARNLGLKVAAGSWITFTDDDDELLPDMVQVSLAAAERSTLPGPVAVLSGIEVVDAHGRSLETRRATTVARQPPPTARPPMTASPRMPTPCSPPSRSCAPTAAGTRRSRAGRWTTC